jgi:hypothetical protein
MRAILLTSATVTSMHGLRPSMPSNHQPEGATLRAAQRTTALAPLTNRRRKVHSSIFEVPASFCLPPEERCNWCSPSQATKSLPRVKVCAGGAKALIAAGLDRYRESLQPVHIPILLGATSEVPI